MSNFLKLVDVIMIKNLDKFVDCVGKHIFVVKNWIRIDKRYLNV